LSAQISGGGALRRITGSGGSPNSRGD